MTIFPASSDTYDEIFTFINLNNSGLSIFIKSVSSIAFWDSFCTLHISYKEFYLLVENYAKGEENELEDTAVFQDLLVSGAIHMNVKAGSKIRNLIAFALQKFQV